MIKRVCDFDVFCDVRERGLFVVPVEVFSFFHRILSSTLNDEVLACDAADFAPEYDRVEFLLALEQDKRALKTRFLFCAKSDSDGAQIVEIAEKTLRVHDRVLLSWE